MGARLLLRLRRAARHAHGPRRRSSPRATSSTTWDERQLARAAARVRRGALRRPDRPRDRPRRAPARRSRRRTELVDVITAAIPAPARFAGGHPAKRTFQAIRIAVNDELDQLDAALPLAWELLAHGRPICRDFLPLAGRPAREALPRRPRARLHLPAGPARSASAAATPRGRAAQPPRDRADARRDRRQPARRRPPGCAPPASSRTPTHDAARRRRRRSAAAPDAAAARRSRARRAASPAPARARRAAAPRAPRPAAARAVAGRAAASRLRLARGGARRIVDARVARPPASRGRAWIALIAVALIGHRLHAGLAAEAERRHRPRGRASADDARAQQNAALRAEISQPSTPASASPTSAGALGHGHAAAGERRATSTRRRPTRARARAGDAAPPTQRRDRRVGRPAAAGDRRARPRRRTAPDDRADAGAGARRPRAATTATTATRRRRRRRRPPRPPPRRPRRRPRRPRPHRRPPPAHAAAARAAADAGARAPQPQPQPRRRRRRPAARRHRPGGQCPWRSIERRIGLLFAVFLVLLGLAGAARRLARRASTAGRSQRAAATQQVVDARRCPRRAARSPTATAPSSRSPSPPRDVSATPYLVKDPRHGGRAARAAARPVPTRRSSEKLARSDTGFVYLARRLPAGQRRAGRRSSTSRASTSTPGHARTYPRDWLASQVLGTVGTDGERRCRASSTRDDKLLHGTDGERRIVRDALGQPISIRDTQPDERRATTLAADARRRDPGQGRGGPRAASAQTYRPKGATAIVMDPRRRRGARARQLAARRRQRPRRRAAYGAAEPRRRLRPTSRARRSRRSPSPARCRTASSRPTRRSTCRRRSRSPTARSASRRRAATRRSTTAQILAQSSNVGAITIGQRLGAQRFDQWVAALRLRHADRRRPARRGARDRPRRSHKYSGSSMGNLPIGQGELGHADADGDRLRRDRQRRHPAHAADRRARSTASASPPPRGHARSSRRRPRASVRDDARGRPRARRHGAARSDPRLHARRQDRHREQDRPDDRRVLGLGVRRLVRRLRAGRRTRSCSSRSMVDEPQGAIYGGTVAAPAFQKIAAFALPVPADPAEVRPSSPRRRLRPRCGCAMSWATPRAARRRRGHRARLRRPQRRARARCSSASPASRATGTTSRPRRSRAARWRWSSSGRSGLGVPEVVGRRRPRRDGAGRGALQRRPDGARCDVVGITGTNGKTTTAFLVRALLEAAGRQTRAARHRRRASSAARERPAVRTTPEAIDLQRDVRARCVDGGDVACAMEVSSHALALHRADAIHWAVARLHEPHARTTSTSTRRWRTTSRQAAAVRGRAAASRSSTSTTRTGARLADEFPDAVDGRRSTRDADAARRRRAARPRRLDVHASPRGAARAALAAARPLQRRSTRSARSRRRARSASTTTTIAAALPRAGRVPGRFEPVDEGQDVRGARRLRAHARLAGERAARRARARRAGA